MNRFDNLSMADLIERERDSFVENIAIADEIRERMRAEHSDKIGKIFRIAKDGRGLAGRLIKVEGVVPNVGGSYARMTRTVGERDVYCMVYGRLNGKSAARDGWTIRRQQVSVERLEGIEP